MDEDRLADLLSLVEEMNEQGRPVSLPDLCRDCPELLPELQRRLHAIQRIEEFVLGPKTPSHELHEQHTQKATPSDPTGDFVSAVSGAAPPVERSPVLGRYRLGEVLGRGGFGEVVRAFDQVLLREVAIKFHRPDRLRQGWCHGLLDEARKLASIEHPNVVRIHDVVEHDGQVLIVSAFIDGSDLNHRLGRGRIPFAEGVLLVAGVADALHHMHLRGLVHRDIKPGNILLDAKGQPYLSDFGLAASEDELLRERPGVQGTYAYMSPEQVRGDSHLVDARTDIYGLGVVLYEVLTGRVPFKAAHSTEYREQILSRPPRPPRTIDDGIPAELERICLKCLAKSVADRYTTAGDLAADLRAAIGAVPPPPEPPPSRRSPLWVGLAVLGAALCAGVTVLAVVRGWLAKPDAPPQPFVGGAAGQVKVRPAPQPGVWQDLLDEEPTVVFRPERFARQFDAVKREFWWDTKGACLIRLGTAQGDDYEIEASFEQAGLPGLRGLFLGLPPATEETPNFAECELVALGVEPLRQKTGVILRARPLLNLASGRVQKLRRSTAEIGLNASVLTRFVLTMRVKGGRLAWVRIDHAPVEGLIADANPTDPPITGDFGVYADSHAGRLLQARWKTYSKEN